MIKTSPSCDPLPIPSYADVQADTQRIAAFLTGLTEDDERFPIAARLLAPQPEGGTLRLARLADTAYAYAYQRGDVADTGIHGFSGDMVALIYGLAERGADREALT